MDSLRYLQFESRSLATLPTLDRLMTASSKPAVAPSTSTNQCKSLSKFLRTASVDSPPTSANHNHVGERLPALLQPPSLVTGSFDDCT